MSTPRSILIIDDDGDFVSLVTEILTQAGYDAASSTQASSAFDMIKSRSFDLIVLDQRMNGLSGSEFLTQLRQTDSTTPVIIVSGFLENASTTEFINLGVSGIFLKPLNIFALLKRVEEIFKGSVKPSGAPMTDNGIRGLTRMPFGNALSKDVFFKKLEALAGFKGNLLIVGEASSPFELIAGELVKKSAAGEKMIAWTPALANPKALVDAVTGAPSVTFLVKKFLGLGAEERATILKTAKHEAPFNVAPPLRFIFCLEEDLDAMYEKKLVNDEFYLFLGSLELKIPKSATVQSLHKTEGLQRAVQNISNTMAPFKAGGGQVLVLDDEDLHAQMVCDLLETAGYKSLKINNPSEALALLKKEKFSLIITDFRMPGINGVDFVTQARQIDPTIPIFIVTGNIQVPEMVRIGNMGVTRLIQKPIDAGKFLSEVASVAKP